jgi:hypothetical protein
MWRTRKIFDSAKEARQSPEHQGRAGDFREKEGRARAQDILWLE